MNLPSDPFRLKQTPAQRPRKSGKPTESFRIGRVQANLRGQVWYIRYHERGRRLQKRASPNKSEARKIAAGVNAQLECNLPSAFGFEQIRRGDLRSLTQLWTSAINYEQRSTSLAVRLQPYCSIRRGE